MLVAGAGLPAGGLVHPREQMLNPWHVDACFGGLISPSLNHFSAFPFFLSRKLSSVRLVDGQVAYMPGAKNDRQFLGGLDICISGLEQFSRPLQVCSIRSTPGGQQHSSNMHAVIWLHANAFMAALDAIAEDVGL